MKGGTPERAGIALTHKTALADAAVGLTPSEAEAPPGPGFPALGWDWGSNP